ncbi:MAG: hypothetical protein JSU81_01515 [Candidatus Coatesbacteria bacterium]|nr:MAG: hypothetical protein JSU81_01515 [Candidatus Coatesbacteria bacterium]
MKLLTAVYFGSASFTPAAQRRALRHFVCLFAAGDWSANTPATCGVALLMRDGKCAVARAAVSPAAFSAQPRFRNVLAAVDGNAVAVLGYGSGNGDADPRAAALQPTQWETTVGLCAADLTNAEAVVADLGWSPEVPSPPALLLRLVNEAFAESTGASLMPAVAARLRLAEGPFVVVAWDRRTPETLIVARAGGDIFAFADEATGVVHFSNRPSLAAGLLQGIGAVPDLADNTLRRYDPSSFLEPESVALFPPPWPAPLRPSRRRPEPAGATPARP